MGNACPLPSPHAKRGPNLQVYRMAAKAKAGTPAKAGTAGEAMGPTAKLSLGLKYSLCAACTFASHSDSKGMLAKGMQMMASKGMGKGYGLGLRLTDC